MESEKLLGQKFIVSFKKYLRKRFMYTLILVGCKQQKPNQGNLSKNETLIHCLYPDVESNFGYLVKILIFHHHFTYEDHGLCKFFIKKNFYFLIFFFFLTCSSCTVIFLSLFVFGVPWLSFWSAKFQLKILFLKLVFRFKIQ